ncbi:L-serine ammonia-lyase [Simkania sp.]|uniref:L-serine ammonia-lyase n=1 Tax=Simkania sp. TaxID=34094 RepID=UPI003B523526
MVVSIFDFFSIGIGPSSSHTVGPMRAARSFILALDRMGIIYEVQSIQVELFGSLAMTGEGHGTDRAVLLGLEGYAPEQVDPCRVEAILERIYTSHSLRLLGKAVTPFNIKKDLLFCKGKTLPYHSNAMRLTAIDRKGEKCHEAIFYSIGGGFIVAHEDIHKKETVTSVPFPYSTGKELLDLCQLTGKSIDEIVFENEKVWRCEEEIRTGLLQRWHIMQGAVKRGCEREGFLPGGLNVRRRAPQIYRDLLERRGEHENDPAHFMDWTSLFAIAVNEENASYGRIVTAPTNGAAGIIPAVLHYVQNFTPDYSEENVVRFLLTAGGICQLFKKNASISGAEVGCQGEVGVACALAAAGLVAIQGGTPEQVENAAEIGIEHNLGLACDPVAGLVQIPCIERNTMGTIKAINAAKLSLLGDGTHSITLDEAIRSMHEIGLDMKSKYKETSEGGLATSVHKDRIRERQLLSLIPVTLPQC